MNHGYAEAFLPPRHKDLFLWAGDRDKEEIRRGFRDLGGDLRFLCFAEIAVVIPRNTQSRVLDPNSCQNLIDHIRTSSQEENGEILSLSGGEQVLEQIDASDSFRKLLAQQATSYHD